MSTLRKENISTTGSSLLSYLCNFVASYSLSSVLWIQLQKKKTRPNFYHALIWNSLTIVFYFNWRAEGWKLAFLAWLSAESLSGVQPNYFSWDSFLPSVLRKHRIFLCTSKIVLVVAAFAPQPLLILFE